MFSKVAQNKKEVVSNDLLLVKQREIIANNDDKIALQEKEIAKKEVLRQEMLELQKEKDRENAKVNTLRSEVNRLLNQIKVLEEKLYFTDIALEEKSATFDNILSKISSAMSEYVQIDNSLSTVRTELLDLEKVLVSRKQEIEKLELDKNSLTSVCDDITLRNKEILLKIDEEKDRTKDELHKITLKVTEEKEIYKNLMIEKSLEIEKKDKFIEQQISTIDRLQVMQEEAEKEHIAFLEKTKSVVDDIKKRLSDVEEREKAVIAKELNIEAIKNKAMIEIGKKARLEKVRIGKEFVLDLITEEK